MAGLGVLPPVRLRHHSVMTAHAPATCGAACDVPVSEVYWSIVADEFAGSGLPVPGIGVKLVDVRENAAVTSVPGATMVGSIRMSTAGPRDEVPAMPRMSSDGKPCPGRDVSELPTMMAFLDSWGAVMLCGRPPALPAL